MIIESIKTVFKVFKTNKMRTFLTMLGMIIGIFSITIILSLSDSTKKSMTDSMSMYYEESIYLYYFVDNYIEESLVSTDLEDYINKNNIISSKGASFYPDDIIKKLETNNEDYFIPEFLGINENYFDSNKLNDYLIDGKLLSKKDIINSMQYAVIREDIAKILFGRSNVVGEILNINNYEFEIIGVLENNNYDVGIYIPYNFVKNYLSNNGTQYQFIVDKDNKTQVEKDIKNILNEYLSLESYQIYSMNLEEYMESFNSIVEIIELVFIGIASLSIIVGGIGIMNIMLVSVSERIKETGIRMALGARNIDIILQFLIEGIMITILSGIIGIILASLGTGIINIFFANLEYDFKLILDITSMLKIILFCGIIGIIFGIYPAIKAGKLDPVEALKYE